MSEMQKPYVLLLHQVETVVAVPCSHSDASGQGCDSDRLWRMMTSKYVQGLGSGIEGAKGFYASACA